MGRSSGRNDYLALQRRRRRLFAPDAICAIAAPSGGANWRQIGSSGAIFMPLVAASVHSARSQLDEEGERPLGAWIDPRSAAINWEMRLS